jgi:hypothetical protein
MISQLTAASARGGNIGLSIVMIALPSVEFLRCAWACLWVACYARGQPGPLDLRPSWFGLEPGRKFMLPLSLPYVLHRNYEAVNNCDTEKAARQASDGPRPTRDGTNAAINHRSNRAVGGRA